MTMEQFSLGYLESWFQATKPQSSRLRRNLFLFAISVLFSVVLFANDPRLAMLQDVFKVILFLLFIGVVIAPWIGLRRDRGFHQQLNRATEHVRMDEWELAFQLIDSLQSRPIRSRSDRHRAAMLLAACFEAQQRFDLSATIYERLLIDRIGDAYQLQEAQLAVVGAKLRNQELTDALVLLGRLEKIPLPPPLKAILDFTRLYQQIFMGHAQDAIENLSERRKEFQRFLSTKAGYAYGLFAAAMHQLGRGEEASDLWKDATTLIARDKLVRDYPLMAPVAAAYPAVEHPV